MIHGEYFSHFFNISKSMIGVATLDGSLNQAHQLTSFLILASPANNSTHGRVGGYRYRTGSFEPRGGKTKGNSSPTGRIFFPWIPTAENLNINTPMKNLCLNRNIGELL